jgi:dolichol-phosphate mannosyltransferase
MEKGVDGLPLTQVIIPALNEEKGIGLTLAELRANLDLNTTKFLVVDGHSCDRTVEIAKNMGADILYQDGFGKGDAIAKAVKNADYTSDYFVLTDADSTYPAGALPQMIEVLEKNPYVGMVCGNRFNHHLDLKALHGIYYFGNRLIAFTHNMFNGTRMQDPLTGLRVVRAKILKDWNVKSAGFDVEVELNHFVEEKGYGIVEMDIMYRHRVGQKKLKINDGAAILKRIITENAY